MDKKFIGSRLHRFRKGPEVPNGIFSAFRPAPASPDACQATSLVALNIPSHLKRSGAGNEVGPGESALFICMNDVDVMMTASGADGDVSTPQSVSVVCSTTGGTFSAPAAWPICQDGTTQVC